MTTHILMRTVSLFLCMRTIYGAISEIEYNALYALYNHQWTELEMKRHFAPLGLLHFQNWSMRTPMARGHLECERHKRDWTLVKWIYLVGMMPAGLGSLSSLQHLSLSINQLTGTVPAELGSLSSLQHLSLSINQLTGTVPAELGSLSSLHHLSVIFPRSVPYLYSLGRLYYITAGVVISIVISAFIVYRWRNR